MTMLNRYWHRALVGAIVIVLSSVVFYGQNIGNVAYAAEKDKVEAAEEHLTGIQAISKTFRMVSKKVKPAVVRIETTIEIKQKVKRPKRPKGGDENDPMEERFREFFDRYGWDQIPDPAPRRGTGSGVVIDAQKGYIITNNHVVSGVEKENGRIDVYMPDKRKFRGKLIGTDPKTDLALIQINAKNLNALKLGDSDSAEVGDWVLAIGAPFGLEQTVTQGIISAKGRSNVGIVGYEDFIQTDAAINPGNSGGPLVNMRGEMIGLNTAIATNGIMAGYMGIGFAIPTKMIKEILPYLREGKEVIRGYLGVEIRALDTYQPGMGRTFGLEKDEGVLVIDVYSGTPASKAGLKADDIIMKYDGKKLASSVELQESVARTKPGTEVDLLVWRDQKEITIPVTIEKQPQDFFVKRAQRSKWFKDEESQEGPTIIETLGMTVEPLAESSAKKYYRWDIEDEDLKDLLVVTEVEPLGEARQLGIRPGNLIISVQGKRITSSGALVRALSAEAINKGVRIRILTKEAGPATLYYRNESSQ